MRKSEPKVRLIRNGGIEGRIVSIAIGGGIAFILGPLVGIAIREDWILNGLMALAFTIGAVIVAHLWPELSWRAGLWFFVFLPPTVLASFLLGPGPPVNWGAELRSLLGYALGLIGACLGGWIGAQISTRRKHNGPSPTASGRD